MALLLFCAGCKHQTPPQGLQAELPTDRLWREDMPPIIKDQVPTYNGEQVAFEMVLIAGNEQRGIKPFYVAKTEVTWAMFEYWAYGGDIERNAKAYAEEIKQGLRPSPLGHGHPQTDLHMMQKDWPATGMSWRVAQAYCRWLSKQTGKNYRLPTDNEWTYLLAQTGGVPRDRETLFKHAMILDNNKVPNKPPFLEMPRPVAQGEPDYLGLYDLLGNAAEWVQPMGTKRWVRGGHFLTEFKDLDSDWIAFEDQDVWNESYPALPISRSWYIDHYYQGIRLVCAIKVPADEVRRKSVDK